MKAEVEKNVYKHMVKYKGKSIIRQHIKNKPINWWLKMWYKCAPKTTCLYEFDIYTGRKEATEFELGEPAVFQLTGKLNGSFCCIFFEKFFTLPSLLRKLTKNLLYGTGVVQQNRTLLPEIEKGKKNAPKEKKQQKIKHLAHGSSFKSEKIFKIEDSNFLVSKDGYVVLQWKDS